MTPQELAAIIFVFCGFGNPNSPTDENFKCMDFMVNCCVVDSKIEKQTVERCKREYELQRKSR